MNCSARCPNTLQHAMQAAQHGLRQGLRPKLAIEGSGGTYFMRDRRHRNVACFKPCDEEPGCVNNPRGLMGMGGGFGLRSGIAAGEACHREVAAFILDHGGFSRVPPTTMAEACSRSFHYGDGKVVRKLGSLQVCARCRSSALTQSRERGGEGERRRGGEGCCCGALDTLPFSITSPPLLGTSNGSLTCTHVQ